MTFLRQYIELTRLQLRSMRSDFAIIAMVQVGFTFGLVLGFGYIIPDISKASAAYLVTGTATQAFVTVGLVMLPQFISQAKAEGRLDYLLTLPISREAYLLGEVTVVALMALPGVALAVVFGSWYYDLSLTPDPMILPVMVLVILSLAGVGVAMAVAIPHMQVVNSLCQLIIFYVLFFSPVILPSEQLPGFLQHAADFMPTSYSADAVRATLTDLPGTDLPRSLLVMSGFAIVSLVLSSVMVRRRG
jgi:ABC-2 type transport system permease protein